MRSSLQTLYLWPARRGRRRHGSQRVNSVRTEFMITRDHANARVGKPEIAARDAAAR
jgi:hypothetical protein